MFLLKPLLNDLLNPEEEESEQLYFTVNPTQYSHSITSIEESLEKVVKELNSDRNKERRRFQNIICEFRQYFQYFHS